MIFLALFLSWGWPPENTAWIPEPKEVPAGLVVRTVNMCCHSMEPALHGGEKLYVELYHGQEIRPGDIVDTGKQMHRVTVVRPDYIRTAGDASKHSDGWTPKARIRWIVRYAVRPK